MSDKSREKMSCYVDHILMEKMMKDAQDSIQRGLDKSNIKKRVVGSDLVSDGDRSLARNKPCFCGSGHKAKKCCVTLLKALENLSKMEK